jgi:hypothetical protein
MRLDSFFYSLSIFSKTEYCVYSIKCPSLFPLLFKERVRERLLFKTPLILAFSLREKELHKFDDVLII